MSTCTSEAASQQMGLQVPTGVLVLLSLVKSNSLTCNSNDATQPCSSCFEANKKQQRQFADFSHNRSFQKFTQTHKNRNLILAPRNSLFWSINPHVRYRAVCDLSARVSCYNSGQRAHLNKCRGGGIEEGKNHGGLHQILARTRNKTLRREPSSTIYVVYHIF